MKRVLSRTRLHNNTTRRPNNYLSAALREIEENCSKKTFTFISGLINEHQKLAETKSDVEKKEAAYRRAKDKL